jgi:hypothetical protein
MSDFEHALEEVKPAFGNNAESLAAYAMHGITNYGEVFGHLQQTLAALVQQVRCAQLPARPAAAAAGAACVSSTAALLPLTRPPAPFSSPPPPLPAPQVRSSEKTPLLSCLLEGPGGSGKSALAATQALASEFPFVKVLGPEVLVGYAEQAKASQITRVGGQARGRGRGRRWALRAGCVCPQLRWAAARLGRLAFHLPPAQGITHTRPRPPAPAPAPPARPQVFEDAYKSPMSIVILDDIERLLEYVAIGPRFSNAVLQVGRWRSPAACGGGSGGGGGACAQRRAWSPAAAAARPVVARAADAGRPATGAAGRQPASTPSRQRPAAPPRPPPPPQVLLVLVKRQPPAGKKLLVIGTSSAGEVLESMGLAEAFNVTLHVPALRADEIVRVLRESDAFRWEPWVVGWVGWGLECSRARRQRAGGGPAAWASGAVQQQGRLCRCAAAGFCAWAIAKAGEWPRPGLAARPPLRRALCHSRCAACPCPPLLLPPSLSPCPPSPPGCAGPARSPPPWRR